MYLGSQAAWLVGSIASGKPLPYLEPFCNSLTPLSGSTLSRHLFGATFYTHPKDIRMSVWKGLLRAVICQVADSSALMAPTDITGTGPHRIPQGFMIPVTYMFLVRGALHHTHTLRSGVLNL